MQFARGHRYSFAIAAAVLLSVLAVLLFQSAEEKLPVAGTIRPSKVRPQLAATWNAAVLLAPDGSLWAWGSTQYTTIIARRSEVPQRVGEDSDWTQIACEWGTFALGLKADGSVWGWSAARSGQLGTSNVTVIKEPARIGLDNDWVQIRAGASHALALKKDGSLWGWGQNDHGQLGDGTRENRFVPIRIGNDKDWRDIAAGHFNGFALKSNGTLWAWGLGIPGSKTNDILKPAQIDAGTNWVAISAGDYHLLALNRDGTLWLRGQNAGNVASAYASNNHARMFQIGTNTDWARLYSGLNGFIGRKVDGSWWACGQNSSSQLGISGQSTVMVPTPIPLPDKLEPWAFDIGHTTGLLLSADGSLWGWGERLGAKEAPGLSKRIKILINRAVKKIGLKTLFHNIDSPPTDHSPVRIWAVPEAN